jgi:hypothetical protein
MTLKNRGKGFMNAEIRIVKRGSKAPDDLRRRQVEKTIQQVQREMASTVKSWIAELTQRKQAQELIYAAIRK